MRLSAPATRFSGSSLEAQIESGNLGHQTPVPNFDLATSRQVPAGTEWEEVEFPREDLGNWSERCHANGFAPVPSHGDIHTPMEAPELFAGGHGETRADHLGSGRFQLRLVD